MSQILYNQEARERVLEGAKVLYEAVKTTMGPKGGNVIFEDEAGNPNVTHDGVTVAKNVNLVDDETNSGRRMGAELIKQAANKMDTSVGDGTTTVTVLTYHILNEANKLIAAGHNPMELRRSLEELLPVILDTLTELAEPIDTKKKVAQVATISAGEKLIGDMIADIVETIGKEGVITVDESPTSETTKEIVEGYTFDRGMLSPYMVTDSSKMEATYANPAILVSDKDITSVRELIPVLEKLAKAGKRELLIVADNISGEALSTLLANHIKGTFNVVAVRAPGVGDRRRDALQDIAVLTGATVLSPDRPTEFDQADENSIGTAAKVIVTEHQTTIIGGGGIDEDVKTHVQTVADRLEAATAEDDKVYLTQRKAALENRVAVIRVGGATETEMLERHYRVVDAVAATKAALKGGIVPGGGVALLRIAKTISDSSDTLGGTILSKALEQPFRIILDNAGLSAERFKDAVLSDKLGTKGVDVSQPNKLVDLKKAGVIDPVAVTKSAVENAVSIAGTAMTMGGLILRPKRPETPDLSGMFMKG